MKWFKHYSDMHDGQSINNLMDELGHTGLCFFLLQEMCAEKLEVGADSDDESQAKFKFHPRIVRQKLRISSVKLERLLSVCSANGLLSYIFTENSLQISMPILLDLLDDGSKKARQRRDKDATMSRLDKDKELDKELDKDKELNTTTAVVKKTTTEKPVRARKEIVHFLSENALVEALPDPVKARWVQLYPDQQFILRETLKAFNYYENNPRKKPNTVQGWVRALSSWYDKSWPRHVKQIESTKVSGYSDRELSEILKGNL